MIPTEKLPFVHIENYKTDFISVVESKKIRDFVIDNLRKYISKTPFNELSDIWVNYDDEGFANFDFKEYKDGKYYVTFISTAK